MEKFLETQINKETMAGIKRKLEQERTKSLIKSRIKTEDDFSTDSFCKGFDSGVEATLEILKDKLNKYRSWLVIEETPKLGKTANFKRTITYRAYVEIINELIGDLERGKE